MQLQESSSFVSPTVGMVQTTHLEQQRSHSIVDTGAVLSVTGELRTWRTILDVYIQDGLCWAVHLSGF